MRTIKQLICVLIVIVDYIIHATRNEFVHCHYNLSQASMTLYYSTLFTITQSCLDLAIS